MKLRRLHGAAEPVDAAVVAGLSLVAAAPLFFIQPRIGGLIALQPPVPLAKALLVLLVLPLPAAYVASISGNRFRVESLAAVVTVPLSLLGARFTAVSLGMVLGLALVSYKASSIFHGDNLFWTRFKAAAALLSVMAVVTGIVAVQTYSGSPAVQNAVEGNVTAFTADTATDVVDLSTRGGAETVLAGLATRAAVNASRSSIAATERTVFTAVERDGSFTAAQRQVLREAFTQAEQDIPRRVGRQARQSIQQQLAERADLSQDVIAGRISPIVETVTAPQPPVLAVLFLTVASGVYVFRLPVGLLAALYALVGRRINRFVENRSGDREEPPQHR